ncbi:MAG: hypothetical protein GWO84_03120, partial [Euryarchaeota archaeon]|nr:hypothetical protein [Euryarchaeota archaeon]
IVEIHSQWKQSDGTIAADQELIQHSRNFSMSAFNERMAEAYSMME